MCRWIIHILDIFMKKSNVYVILSIVRCPLPWWYCLDTVIKAYKMQKLIEISNCVIIMMYMSHTIKALQNLCRESFTCLFLMIQNSFTINVVNYAKQVWLKLFHNYPESVTFSYCTLIQNQHQWLEYLWTYSTFFSWRRTEM